MILFCDCFSGISGDMFLGGLIDIGLSVDTLRSELIKLKIPFEIEAKHVLTGSIRATQFLIIDPEKVQAHHPHQHRPARELVRIVQESDLDESIKKKSISIIWKIAQAEGKIHGQKPEDVYLHEIGGLDTLIDITGALIGLSYFKVSKIISSPIPTGSGLINTSHGILPIPAPATIELLKGIPIQAGQTTGELTTPTGAAIISTLADQFGTLPKMIVEKIGYGAGYYDYDRPNVLRLLLGYSSQIKPEEENILIETNLDDMSPQIIEYVSEKLFENGALDVFTTPIYMKKQRPAFQLSVLVSMDKAELLRNIIFQETTTLGVREVLVKKVSLHREDRIIQTVWGKTKVKISYLPKGIKVTPEYEECKKIAREFNIPLLNVFQMIQKTALQILELSQITSPNLSSNQDPSH